MDVNQQVRAILKIRKMIHDNGMDIFEYANGVMSGELPVLGHEEFKDQFGGSAADMSAVKDWAVSKGLTIENAYRSSATVIVNGTAGIINSLFNITMKQGEDEIGVYQTYSGNLTIPQELEGIVEFVIGLDESQRIQSHYIQLDNQSVYPNTVQSVTPPNVANMYNWPYHNGDGQCVAIAEFGGGYTTQNLTSTFGAIGLSNPTVVDVSVLGGTNSPDDGSGASVEVMLDIYLVGGIVPKAKIAMYFCPNSTTYFPTVIDAVANDYQNSPNTLSISWGAGEDGFEITGARGPFESSAAAALVKGLNIFASSGDYGASIYSSGSPIDVNYPAVSTYVISCGGTQIDTDGISVINSEVVWNQGGYAGGGGLSIYASLPSYQTGLFYKPTNSTSTALTMRGHPDISGNASPYSGYIFYANYGTGGLQTWYQTGGTSATAPMYAALFARIYQLTGKKFTNLHSFLYSNTGIFNDVTVGNNKITNNPYGYAATVGWDMASGLGSIIGKKLYKLVNTGGTFPKLNKGTRPTKGQCYPRPITGIR